MARQSSPAAEDGYGVAMWIGRTAIYAVLVFFALFFLIPFVVVVFNSIRPYEEITNFGLVSFPRAVRLENFVEAWSTYCVGGICNGISPYMWNSFLIVVPATVLSAALGALNGYALSLWRFRGDSLLFGALILGIFLPHQLKLIPWVITMRELGLFNTLTGLVLIHVLQGLSFSTLFFRNYYSTIPIELIKAARIDGAGFFRIFRRIVLPLSPPIIIVTVIWQFTWTWNEFLYGVTFTRGESQPVTAALVALNVHFDMGVRYYNLGSAAALMAALPTVLIYLFGGKYFVRGLTAGAVK